MSMSEGSDHMHFCKPFGSVSLSLTFVPVCLDSMVPMWCLYSKLMLGFPCIFVLHLKVLLAQNVIGAKVTAVSDPEF